MASSTPRSFSRSGGMLAGTRNIHSCVLLDAALERCGSVSSEIDASGVAQSASCCDTELAKLSHACWTCSKPASSAALCAAASAEADIAVGMSTCRSRMPLLHSTSPHLLQRPHSRARRSDSGENYRPSTLFLVAFFAALALLAVAVLALIVHRCRKARPYQKRAHRRAVLDLMEGFTPVEERKAAAAAGTSLTRPGTPSPEHWVPFSSGPGSDGFVSPPPPARSRTPSPTPTLDEMVEVPRGRGVRPVAHGLEVPQLLLNTLPPQFERGATVIPSPMVAPVPIRRY